MNVLEGIFSENFWYMAPILASLTVTIAGAINKKFTGIKGFWKQFVAWAVGSVLSVGAWLLGLVQLGEPTWVSAIALCAVVGLSSNGIYDIPTVHNWINKLFTKLNIKA